MYSHFTYVRLCKNLEQIRGLSHAFHARPCPKRLEK